jgi:SAM-dependent methyltransferase
MTRQSYDATNEFEGEALAAIGAESQAVWDANAAAYDARMGDQGNSFQRQLVFPAAERLLEAAAGQQILEIACGNGAFARRLGGLGARVLACDFSAGQLANAKARTRLEHGPIEYRQVDAANTGELLMLGQNNFDSAVCNMALMDMPAVEPLFAALPRLLKPGGRFVFVTMHPCFNQSGAALFEEAQHAEDGWAITRGIKVTRYLSAGREPRLGNTVIGQPRPQYYFERPLQVLLNAAFRNGLVLDGVEECAFQAGGDPRRSFEWENLPEIPPVLAGRLRPAR